ncbi:MAG: hypothetical protein GY760_04850 [Deltaproteobacteria bacterium]|nr:hypothetical protein [Deltaproteobacteria bacterium]
MAEETLLNELNKNGNRDEMLQPDAIFILNRLSYINCRHYADGPKIDHVEHGEIQGWLMMKSNDSTLFELINFVHTYVPIPLLMTSPLKSYFSSIPPYETKFTKFTNSTG